MKKILLFSFFSSCTLLGWGQTETLFNDIDVVGAFGGPFVEFSSIADETVINTGGGGALVLNDFFLGGYGLTSKLDDYRFGVAEYDLELKHGGFWLGITPQTDKLLHFYGSARVGWGKAKARGSGPQAGNDNVFVVTPEIGFEINIFDWFRIAGTGGYRLVSGVDDFLDLDNQSFNSPVGTITFRIGGFTDVDNWGNDWEDW